jgi:hypothetical protein
MSVLSRRRRAWGSGQTRNILRDLKNDGVISIQKGGGRGVSNRYRVHTETMNSVSVKPDFSEAHFSEICDRNLAIQFAKPCNL